MTFDSEMNGARDEEVLAASFKKPSLFRILVERYEEPFVRKAQTVLRSAEDAEDVVQETFVKIYRRGHTFEKRPNIEFKSWAYKILMNTAFTRYAKLKREVGNVPFEDFLEAETEPPFLVGDNYAMREEARQSVQATLAKMPVALANAMRAYYFDGKSYQDIAHEEQISLSSLKMRLFRARRLFRKIFEA